MKLQMEGQRAGTALTSLYLQQTKASTLASAQPTEEGTAQLRKAGPYEG
jgi:hypothetical protein